MFVCGTPISCFVVLYVVCLLCVIVCVCLCKVVVNVCALRCDDGLNLFMFVCAVCGFPARLSVCPSFV